MDDPKLIAGLSEHLIGFQRQIADLRASVEVLKVLEAMRLNPTDPQKGLELIRQLEQRHLELDPLEQKRNELGELVKILQKMKATGATTHKA